MSKTSHDSETPAHGQQVITAAAFIHHNFDGTQKLFMSRRAKTKKFLPGILELPGGHINFGEDLVEGLKREVREELEMEILVGDPFAAFTYHNPIKGSHSIEVVFFAQFIGDITAVKLHLDDHSEHRWFSEAELPEIALSKKDQDDPETEAIIKGFQLLNKKV